MLGLRTTVKENLKASPADMVYGGSIAVPGEFLPSVPEQAVPPSVHLQRLRMRTRTFTPRKVDHHGNKARGIFSDALKTAEFVFIRRDGYKSPLQPPYEGPFKVLERGEKFFKIEIGPNIQKVSVDRLKKAQVEPQTAMAQPPRRGRPRKLNEQCSLPWNSM